MLSAIERTHGGTFIVSLLKEFPNCSSHTLASIAIKRAPALFKHFEAARRIVRYYRGASGVDRRKYKIQNTPMKPIPPGITRMKDWKPFEIAGPCRVLVVGDSHIPYHDAGSLRIAIESAKASKVNVILLNGDTLDCHAVSFWQTDPRERDFKNELGMCRDFLEHIRDSFPKAEIIYKLGNHEERWEKFMISKAPELLDVEEFQLSNLLRFKQFGISLVEDKRPILIGDLNVIHGHEYKFAISNPVNPARGLFLRAKAYAMCNHFHQSSYHTEKNINEEIIATWSLGCMCDMHPQYMPMNNWAHGFAIVEVGNSGKFHVEQKIIRNGKIY